MLLRARQVGGALNLAVEASTRRPCFNQQLTHVRVPRFGGQVQCGIQPRVSDACARAVCQERSDHRVRAGSRSRAQRRAHATLAYDAHVVGRNREQIIPFGEDCDGVGILYPHPFRSSRLALASLIARLLQPLLDIPLFSLHLPPLFLIFSDDFLAPPPPSPVLAPPLLASVHHHLPLLLVRMLAILFHHRRRLRLIVCDRNLLHDAVPPPKDAPIKSDNLLPHNHAVARRQPLDLRAELVP
eukprot:4444662-Pleurochrysis_carterae.AAC.2